MLHPCNPTVGREIFGPMPVRLRKVQVRVARVEEDRRRFAIREALGDIEEEAVVVVGQIYR